MRPGCTDFPFGDTRSGRRSDSHRISFEKSSTDLDFVGKATLDTMPANVAILSSDGTIVAVNRAWKQFAYENVTPALRESIDQYCEGENYLRICERARGKDSEAAQGAAAGIRAVAAGRCSYFTLDYPCHSPTQRRWYRMRVTPFSGVGSARVAVAHEEITELKLAEETVNRLKDDAAAKKALFERSERIAQILQRSLLQTSPDGELPGINISTLYQPAGKEAQVGGDFFDAFHLGGTKVAFVIGDVSGKGIIAAGRTAEVKYALRVLLHEHGKTDLALTRLNNYIFKSHITQSGDRETFIVLSLAVVDTATGDMEFCCAGSEPLLILRANGETEQFVSEGVPLGVLTDTTYTSLKTELSQRDTLMMVTDGLTEARSNQQFLLIDGVARLAEDGGPTLNLSELAEVVYAGTVQFADGRLHDDVCLLFARRT